MLQTVIYIFGIIPGLFFGISYIVTKSEIDDKRKRNICIWLSIVYLFGFGFSLINIIKTGNGYISGISKLILVPVVYFFSKFVLNRAEKIRRSFLGKLGRRKVEFISIGVYTAMFLIVTLSLTNAVINNNRLILEFLPLSARQQIESQMNQYQEFQKKQIDDAKLQQGQLIVNQLESMNYLFNGRYPDNLKDDKLIQMSEQFSQQISTKDTEQYNIKLNEFSYQSFDEGQSFRLCIELSTSQKCWEHIRRLYQDDTYQFKFYYPADLVIKARDDGQGYDAWDEKTYKPEFSSVSCPTCIPKFTFFVKDTGNNLEKFFYATFNVSKDDFNKILIGKEYKAVFGPQKNQFYAFGGNDQGGNKIMDFILVKGNFVYAFVAYNDYNMENILGTLNFAQ